MSPTIASLVSTAFYCLSAVLIYRQLGSQQPGRWISLVPALIALLLQASVLNQLMYHPDGLNLGFFVALALVFWLIAIQILLSSIFHRIETLGIVVFPVSGLSVLLASLGLSEDILAIQDNVVQGHIIISVIAYSLIMLGAIQACLLAYQDHAIRSHHPGGFVRFLPPLHAMETLLFQLLGFGFICLSGALISGFIYLEDIFAQHLVHKTVLSIIAWFILGILLFGRLQFGWRGKIAIRWTLAAFGFLMLAFFGSKLVLEFLL